MTGADRARSGGRILVDQLALHGVDIALACPVRATSPSSTRSSMPRSGSSCAARGRRRDDGGGGREAHRATRHLLRDARSGCDERVERPPRRLSGRYPADHARRTGGAAGHGAGGVPGARLPAPLRTHGEVGRGDRRRGADPRARGSRVRRRRPRADRAPSSSRCPRTCWSRRARSRTPHVPRRPGRADGGRSPAPPPVARRGAAAARARRRSALERGGRRHDRGLVCRGRHPDRDGMAVPGLRRQPLTRLRRASRARPRPCAGGPSRRLRRPPPPRGAPGRHRDRGLHRRPAPGSREGARARPSVTGGDRARVPADPPDRRLAAPGWRRRSSGCPRSLRSLGRRGSRLPAPRTSRTASPCRRGGGRPCRAGAPSAGGAAGRRDRDERGRQLLGLGASLLRVPPLSHAARSRSGSMATASLPPSRPSCCTQTGRSSASRATGISR